MIRGLSFPFLLFIGIMSFLVTLAVDSDNNLYLLVNAEEEHQDYKLLFIESSSYYNGGDLYYGAVFIKELENLIKNFEYTFDLERSQIFPNNNIKQDIVSEYKSSDYNIDDLNY
jgi:hypothetical protein